MATCTKDFTTMSHWPGDLSPTHSHALNILSNKDTRTHTQKDRHRPMLMIYECRAVKIDWTPGHLIHSGNVHISSLYLSFLLSLHPFFLSFIGSAPHMSPGFIYCAFPRFCPFLLSICPPILLSNTCLFFTLCFHMACYFTHNHNPLSGSILMLLPNSYCIVVFFLFPAPLTHSKSLASYSICVSICVCVFTVCM